MQRQINVYIEALKDKKSNNTILAYRGDLLKFSRFLSSQGVKDFGELQREHVERYLEQLANEHASNRTISRNATVLRLFIRDLKERQIIIEDFENCVVAPKVIRRDPRAAENEIKEKLISVVVGDTPKALRDRMILYLLCDLGIAIEEIVNLRVSDYNREFYYINTNKGAYPIDQVAISDFEKYVNSGRQRIANDSEYLFTNMYGGKISRQGIWKAVKSYQKKAGISELTLSMLKHTK